VNLIVLVDKDFQADARHALLEGRRAIHLQEVLRARLGTVVRVGLLNGPMGKGVVVAQADAQVKLEVNLSEASPPPLPGLLLVALPRPKSLRRILQTAAAFGVEGIVLMESWRVEKNFWGSTLLEPASLNEQLILGLEQGCGTRLPDVLIRRRFRPFAEDELPGMASGRLALLAHPRSGTLCPAHVQEPFCVAFGPEGGWTDRELSAARAGGFQAVSLGAAILKAETAAIVGASLIRYELGK